MEVTVLVLAQDGNTIKIHILRYYDKSKVLDETVTAGEPDLLGSVGNAFCNPTAESLCADG